MWLQQQATFWLLAFLSFSYGNFSCLIGRNGCWFWFSVWASCMVTMCRKWVSLADLNSTCAAGVMRVISLYHWIYEAEDKLCQWFTSSDYITWSSKLTWIFSSLNRVRIQQSNLDNDWNKRWHYMRLHTDSAETILCRGSVWEENHRWLEQAEKSKIVVQQLFGNRLGAKVKSGRRSMAVLDGCDEDYRKQVYRAETELER